MILAFSTLFAAFEAKEKACIEPNTDITGNNVNDGLSSKFSSMSECIDYCRGTSGANYFVWSDETFFDPNYQFTCWCKANKLDTSYSTGTFSGPLNCAPEANCCSNIHFTSTGSLANSDQSHVLGYYSMVSDGEDGHPNYQQTTQLRSYMFYRSNIKNWFINDATGINQGYALNTGSETCITDSTGVWEFYDFGVGDWVPDPTAQTVCVDEVPPPPEEQCNTGSLCDGCVVTLPFGDTVYCCKEQCQYGWINYDPNTNPMCQCGV